MLIDLILHAKQDAYQMCIFDFDVYLSSTLAVTIEVIEGQQRLPDSCLVFDFACDIFCHPFEGS